MQDFINFALRYIADLKLPFKRGTFVEFRTGMLNISPVGRNCTIEERNQFNEYDQENQIREKFIQALKKEFPNLALTYSIGTLNSRHYFVSVTAKYLFFINYFLSQVDKFLLTFFPTDGTKLIACGTFKDTMKFTFSATRQEKGATTTRFTRAT